MFGFDAAPELRFLAVRYLQRCRPDGADKGVPGDAGDDLGGFPRALPLANFRCPFGTFLGCWLDRGVEREGFIRFLTVRNLIFGVTWRPKDDLRWVLKVRPVRGPGLQWRSYGRSVFR